MLIGAGSPFLSVSASELPSDLNAHLSALGAALSIPVPSPCIWHVWEERLLQSLCFIRDGGDQVVVLLVRPGHSLLGLDLSQHREGTHPPHGAVDPVRCSLIALWQQSLVSHPSQDGEGQNMGSAVLWA